MSEVLEPIDLSKGCRPRSAARPRRSAGGASAWHAEGHGFDPRVWQHSFVEIGHEIISTTIQSLPLIQVGQLAKGCALRAG